jgi:hypothetical protein
MVVDKRRRQVTKEFEGLSHAGRIDYCVKKLARIDQLEGDVRNMMASPSYVPSDAQPVLRPYASLRTHAVNGSALSRG